MGQPQAAMAIFEEVLVGLGETVSYDLCVTLFRLGRCWATMGQPTQAVTLDRQALAELAKLEPNDGVKRQIGATQADLADSLTVMGDYGAAREAYEVSLAIVQELDDRRSIGVINIQLGTLAMREGNLAEAETRYQSALTTFRTLDEPGQESNVWHQLGRVYQEVNQWEQAEQAYRASAQLKEAQGNLAEAAGTWNNLALVCQYSGKLHAAEAWFRKAIEASKKVGDTANVAHMLNNLADLLQTQGPSRLSEAREFAEEALVFKQILDPNAATIWTTYTILARIATQQGAAVKAQDYRRQSRQSYAAFAGSRQMLKQNEGWIQGVVMAVGDAAVRQQLEKALSETPAFATAIRQIWAGGRDEDGLCDGLDFGEGAIVVEILKRLRESR